MLRNIYIKEMKDSFRDRRTLLLTVLLPIIIMTGLVLFYEKMLSNDSSDTYQLAVDESFSTEEHTFLRGLDNIEIVKSSDPEEALKEGEAQAALLLSDDFINRVRQGEDATATIIGDSFSQDASQLMALVTAGLERYKTTVITERLSAEQMSNDLLEPFTLEQKDLTDDSNGVNMLALLIPLILTLSIGIGASPAGADLFAGEKEKKTMEALLMTPVNRMHLLVAKWMTITSIGAITGLVTLIVVALEIGFLTENLRSAVEVSFANHTYQIIGFSLLVSLIYAMFVATLLMLTSIVGKTVKEAQSYSTPIMMVVVFPVMITSEIGINELSLYHFAIPVMNIFTSLKELCFGIIDYQHLGAMVGSNLLFIIIVFVIGRIMFLKDKWVIN
ncbi:ABC transporter permease [Radiobacillus deserti]|uniref:ABC transporter permease n=1 Tax=Radiobacillus deserti TaxID=2594883 RepID=A0A516KD01_9BACI|nr:ABC transporter permease subunit [Radiobacillus deserti]QDP39281.1 ABC transporter permease [Radiobacillus deserti]